MGDDVRLGHPGVPAGGQTEFGAQLVGPVVEAEAFAVDHLVQLAEAVALVGVFLGFAWFARKREDWVQPILMGVAMATLFGGLLFLGVPLVE